MKLSEIYKKQADYVRASGYRVIVDELHGTVAIDPIAEHESHEGFFLQDDEASAWINEARKVWDDALFLRLDDAFYGHAKQYVDAI